MPGVSKSATVPLLMVESRETKFFAALVANNTGVTSRITPITLTLTAEFSATASATTATNTASGAPGRPILSGTPLLFVDSAGSYLARVAADSSTGSGLSLTATETIPNGAAAVWPPEVDLVTDHTLGTQTTINNESTYQHKGSGQAARGDTSRTFNLTCRLSDYSAGQKLLTYSVDNEQDIYLEVQQPNPDSNAFSTPPIRFGVAKMSDGSQSGQNGQNLGLTFAGTFSGVVTELDPAA